MEMVHKEGRLYMFGGQDEDGERSNEFWSYDLGMKKWNLHETTGTVPSVRHSNLIYFRVAVATP